MMGVNVKAILCGPKAKDILRVTYHRPNSEKEEGYFTQQQLSEMSSDEEIDFVEDLISFMAADTERHPFLTLDVLFPSSWPEEANETHKDAIDTEMEAFFNKFGSVVALLSYPIMK